MEFYLIGISLLSILLNKIKNKNELKGYLLECYEHLKKICNFYFQKVCRQTNYNYTIANSEDVISLERLSLDREDCLKYLDLYYEQK